MLFAEFLFFRGASLMKLEFLLKPSSCVSWVSFSFDSTMQVAVSLFTQIPVGGFLFLIMAWRPNTA